MPPTRTLSTSAEVELLRRRVDDLETGLAALRNQLNGRPTTEQQAGVRPWWESRAGAFADDPGFEELVDLGRQWREAERAEASTFAEPDDRSGEARK